MMVGEGSRGLLGSKGFDLFRCTLLGIDIPEFRIIGTDLFRKYSGLPFDNGFEENLKETLIALGGKVAVRSSSVVEDLSLGSKAGMFRTVLGVDSYEKLVKAIREVWASSDGHDMAVIIQTQVDPEIAGVLFTRDPVTGKNSTIVEYVHGPCSILVSGRADPERIEMENDVRAIADLQTGPEGIRLDPLIEMSRRLEAGFGYPVDIEWAYCEKRFHILQVRPITGLPAPGPETRTYSRVQAEQFYSGPVTPLFHSIFREIFTRFYLEGTLRELGIDIEIDEEFLVRHRNFLYIDTRVMEYALGALPPEKVPEGIRSTLPPDIRERTGKIRKLDIVWIAWKLACSLLRHRERRISMLDEHFRTEVVFEVLCRLGRIGDPKDMDQAELKECYLELMEIVRLHVGYSKWGLILYSIPILAATENLLRRNGLEGHLPDLISGFDHNMTMDASEDIRYLASMVRSSPPLMAALEGDHDHIGIYRDRIGENEGGDRFLEAFDNMLGMYGHRRISRDIYQPSWKDDPMIPFSMIRELALAGDGPFTEGKKADVSNRRMETEKKIKGSLGSKDRIIFRMISKHLVRYIRFREYQRFYLDLVLAKVRELVLEVSARMLEERVIEREDDIFFLEIGRLMAYLSGERTEDLRNTAAFNRASYEDRSGTPGMYLRSGIDFDDTPMDRTSVEHPVGKAVRGNPVSSGEHRGRIKVLRDLRRDVRIEAGDILVTEYIDPGQTHLFLKAGALVLEVGGLLSHGAILAREFNIPTVAGIRDATRIFKDSQEAVVNGTRGTVTILD
ncbi:MAG: PEP/pyruvate-binding domain-containing protein [Thermoplasmatota archaeon]